MRPEIFPMFIIVCFFVVFVVSAILKIHNARNEHTQ